MAFGLAVALALVLCKGITKGSDSTSSPKKPNAASRKRLFPIRQGIQKHGYMDSKGRVVIESRFAWTEPFAEGLAAVQVGSLDTGKFGYIDEGGKLVIPAQFEKAEEFSEGLAAVQVSPPEASVGGERPQSLWGYVDKKGKMRIKPAFVAAGQFSKGRAAVMLPRKRWTGCGFIDKTGAFVVPAKYFGTYRYRNGLARVIVSGWLGSAGARHGFIDRAGKEVIKPRFGYSEDFSEGLAAVRVDEKWGYIDKTGKLVIAAKYGRAHSFSEGLAAVRVGGIYNPLRGEHDGDKAGYIDRTGQFVIPPKFETGLPFSEGLARFAVYDPPGTVRWGFIDRTGKVVIKAQFHDAEDFSGGLAQVGLLLEDYIDKRGKYVWRNGRRVP